MKTLLVGAGHTHLYVVAHAAELRAAGWEVTLLAPRWFDYSGVASATATAALPAETGRIDVVRLASRSETRHHEGTLVSLDHDQRLAIADDGTELAYDVVSFNLGSTVEPAQLTVEDGVLRVKPLARLADLDARLRAANGPSRVTVAGAGSSGIELAAHLSLRADVGHVRLVEAGPRIAPDLPERAARRLAHILEERGVEVGTERPITHLAQRHADCADGTELTHDLAILATGLTAPPLVHDLGLGDRDGIPVRATLQHRDLDDVYAVGDCAHFLPRPLPRVGVHGVRQGPVLVESLLARRERKPLPTYEPQRKYLSILDLGGGSALAFRGDLWWEGRSALRLKRWIDRRWLRGYQNGAGSSR